MRKIRLIDADRIKTNINNSDFMYDIKANIQDLIKEQQTAYDVDKVIKEINTMCNVYWRSLDEQTFAQDVIDIVRNGVDFLD